MEVAPVPASSEAPLPDIVDNDEKQLEEARSGEDGETRENTQQTNEGTNANEERETGSNVGELEKTLSELGNSMTIDHVMMGDQPMREEDESSPQQMDVDSDEDDDNDGEMVGVSGVETEELDNNTSKRSSDDRYRSRQRGRNRGKGRRKGGREGKGRRKGKGRGKARQRYPFLADGVPSVKVNTVIAEETGEEAKSGSKFKSCDQLRCMGGGRCVKDLMREGVRCQCKLGTDGTFCEKGG